MTHVIGLSVPPILPGNRTRTVPVRLPYCTCRHNTVPVILYCTSYVRRVPVPIGSVEESLPHSRQHRAPCLRTPPPPSVTTVDVISTGPSSSNAPPTLHMGLESRVSTAECRSPKRTRYSFKNRSRHCSCGKVMAFNQRGKTK